MAIQLQQVSFGYAGGDALFENVSLRVASGECIGLVGPNGVGKSTILRLVARELEPAAGTVRVDGSVAALPQDLGRVDERTTVRELLVGLSSPRLREIGRALLDAEYRHEREGSDASGLALADSVARWGEAGGYREEQHWTTCTERVLRQPFGAAEGRLLSELSGGERKRLALEVLLDSDIDALLLDEPDNFLDVAGKAWLEARLRAARKTILLVSHDRELLSRAPAKIVTIEAQGAWTHGDTFATYHEARDARNARLGDAVSRWQQEERRLFRHYKLMKQRAALNDSNQGQANAAESRWERWVQAGPPPEPPKTRGVKMRLRGGRSGKRVLECTQLEISGLTEPFDLSVWFGERVAVLGPNGTGKSHFLRMLGGATIEHVGEWKLGAEVRPALFHQTNEPEGFAGKTPVEILEPFAPKPAVLAALARYGIRQCADLPFDILSGGQRARAQILALELGRANLLLLDEPTDNLDLDSAEALQDALEQFDGTLLAVTHDRWFMKGFDRFVVFRYDCSVTEAADLERALELLAADRT
jgi:ATPase subunit of ABC transporter with duplicated ATPase domains